MSRPDPIRLALRAAHLAPEADLLARLSAEHAPSADLRARTTARGADLVRKVRGDAHPGLMEVFLAEYGLSTQEGVALMCLAEALLRVPDADTMDALIEDKIAPSSWGSHLGKSSSSLVNASTWALMLTGQVLKDGVGVASVLKGAIKRMGEPVIRAAVGRAMKELGAQFVLGQTIDEALTRGAKRAGLGYTYSYDMLGEAAMTAHDAAAFHRAYAAAIARLAGECKSPDIRDNPGISIKLSALHPRYEISQKPRVMSELVEATRQLCLAAREAGMGLNIDAEEADRLDLSLDVIEAVLSDPRLAGWEGFGVVVQAYGRRAPMVIDWLYALAERLDRKIMVRLVKGAYWDSEIKKAQVEGLRDFPVFTTKAATDVSYVCNAAKLLGMRDRIYPQFATHNAHTVAAILEMSDDRRSFEFQRLHGMGEALHEIVRAGEGTRCRIYAPVGAHRDLLAYLVRRLLENGANSSFVNQIVNESVLAETVAADPFVTVQSATVRVTQPTALFGDERANSKGFDLRNSDTMAAIHKARDPWQAHRWQAAPMLAVKAKGSAVQPVINPADPSDIVGHVREATAKEAAQAVAAARPWAEDAATRAATLNRVADLYEAEFGQIFAILSREAGKGLPDAVAELREAVDFLRYYAARAAAGPQPDPRGTFTCISPWNFPLAIFTGQISAALAMGNAVLAKPAETTPLIAAFAVGLMHKAGVPVAALQLLPGAGAVVGTALTSDAAVNGVCFTGSTATAQRINRAMADHLAPDAPLIAETGGLNAMIVDSTALPEQAVRDIVASAFQSAGQRCSALRVLYLQEDIAAPFLKMLFGAMDQLTQGNPWHHSTDIGPVITEIARADIQRHIEVARGEGRVMKEMPRPVAGHFIGPTVLRLSGIGALEREIFGPVLHVATYRSDELDAVVDAINARGFGLTFGMHSRIDDRVEQVISRLRMGNIYVNRNQIGAVVGVQPFGGEGLSGTGPKAGGPGYMRAFAAAEQASVSTGTGSADADAVQKAINAAKGGGQLIGTETLPGPTGESNRLSTYGRDVVLCMGPGQAAVAEQARQARANGAAAVEVQGNLDPQALTTLTGFDAVALWSDIDGHRAARQALAARDGAILPLLTDADIGPRCHLERHICIDTTAAGGNAQLLAQAS